MDRKKGFRIAALIAAVLFTAAASVFAGGRGEKSEPEKEQDNVPDRTLTFFPFLNDEEFHLIEEYSRFFEEVSGINMDLEEIPAKTIEEYTKIINVKSAAGETFDLFSVPASWNPGNPLFEWAEPLPEDLPRTLRHPHLSVSHDAEEVPRALHPWLYFSAFLVTEDLYRFLVSRGDISPGDNSIEMSALLSAAEYYAAKSRRPVSPGTAVDMFAQFELSVSSEILYNDHTFFERVSFGEEPLANNKMFRALQYFARSASNVIKRGQDFRDNSGGLRKLNQNLIAFSGISTAFNGLSLNDMQGVRLLMAEKEGRSILPVHRGPGIAVSANSDNAGDAFWYIAELIQPEIQMGMAEKHRGFLPAAETPAPTLLDQADNVFLSLYQYPMIGELNLWDVMTKLWRAANSPKEAMVILDKRAQQLFGTPRGKFDPDLSTVPVLKDDRITEEEKTVAPSDNEGPVIEIIAPQAVSRGREVVTKEKTLTLYGRVADDSGIFEVLVNGSAASVSESGEFSKELRLVYGDNSISIKAEDVLGNITDKSYSIERAAAEVEVPEDQLISEVEKPFIIGNYYALIVGVEDYIDTSINDLEYAYNDAESVYSTLSANYTFEPSHMILLENPTRRELIQAFTGLRETVTKEDNLLVYYAGHGYWDEAMGQGYWLLRDAKKEDPTDWISNSTVSDYLRAIPSKHTLLISDACFFGGIFKTRSAFSELDESVKQIYKLPSRKAITSGALNTVPDKSVFTEHLVKALGRNSKKYLDAQGLFMEFRDAVIDNSPMEQTPLYGVISQTGDEGGDFIFQLAESSSENSE